MDAELKAKWVEALRSGEYQQQRFFIGDGRTLCCIGVCGAVKGMRDTDNEWGTYDVARIVGLPEEQRDHLIKMNDEFEAPFSEIADWVELNL